MTKFRKKPVVIDAEQYLDGMTVEGMCSTINCRFINPHIHTLEGEMHVSDNDWIICGVRGEYYPCKPDIFKETYEAII